MNAIFTFTGGVTPELIVHYIIPLQIRASDEVTLRFHGHRVPTVTLRLSDTQVHTGNKFPCLRRRLACERVAEQRLVYIYTV
jgi:hypothetical protein